MATRIIKARTLGTDHTLVVSKDGKDITLPIHAVYGDGRKVVVWYQKNGSLEKSPALHPNLSVSVLA